MQGMIHVLNSLLRSSALLDYFNHKFTAEGQHFEDMINIASEDTCNLWLAHRKIPSYITAGQCIDTVDRYETSELIPALL